MKFDASAPVFQGYIILEWIGRWIVPDTAHGGASSRLFRLKADAEKSLNAYLDRQASFCWPEERARERAEQEKRHCIVPIAWPQFGPDGEETE